MPREASQHFGDCLMPYVEDLVNLSKGQANICSAVKNAVICQNGALAPSFRYISDMRNMNDSKSVLILGAGYVSAPVVDFLASKGKKLNQI